MPTIEARALIKASPEKVWSFLVTQPCGCLPGYEAKTTLTCAGFLTVGSTFSWEGIFMGQRLRYDGVVTEYERNRRLSWKTTSNIKTNVTWVLKLVDSGAMLTLIVDYSMPYSFIGTIYDRLKFNRQFSRYINEKWLGGVTSFIESTSKQ